MNIPSAPVTAPKPNTASRISSSLASVNKVLILDSIEFDDDQYGLTVMIPEGKILRFSKCSNLGFSFSWSGNSALIIENCFLRSGIEYFDYLLNINSSLDELKYTLKSSYNDTGRPVEDNYWQIIGGLS